MHGQPNIQKNYHGVKAGGVPCHSNINHSDVKKIL
jgi:hypothetical protein